MSIWDRFTGGQPQQQEQPAGQQPPKQEEGQPNTPATPGDTNKEVDIFSSLFDNTNGSDEDTPPSFSLDDEAVQKAAQSMNFANSVSQEDLQAMQSGDPEALMRVLNSVGQSAYSAALQHSTKLTDKYVNTRSEYDRKNIPSMVKQQLASSEFSDENTPPHVKAELHRVAEQLQRRHPDASPKWIAENAQEYMYHSVASMLKTDVASLKQALSQQNNASQAVQQDPANIDWEKEFNS